jgi:hypothetical protein
MKSIKNKWLSASVLAAVALACSGCHKQCLCLGYDGSEVYYSAEEVEERGVTCPNMIYQAGQQFYSVCGWD